MDLLVARRSRDFDAQTTVVSLEHEAGGIARRMDRGQADAAALAGLLQRGTLPALVRRFEAQR